MLQWLVWAVLAALACLRCPTVVHGITIYPVPDSLKYDRDALLALKSVVTSSGFGKSRMQTWNSDGHPCRPAPWPHITCKLFYEQSTWTPRIWKLNLTSLNVQAMLPAKLGQLTAADSIMLDGNRFTGTLPKEWANRQYFTKLKTLSLRSNRLSGTLPNTWNIAGAWPALQTLDLSQNRFVGGLPRTWLGSNKPFKTLAQLDLSENLLGYQPNGTRLYTSSDSATGWCQQGVAADGSDGWCPTAANMRPALSKMPRLSSLDVSKNSFTGLLPSKWGWMFPALQFLLLHSNTLYVSKPGVAQGLPSSWVQKGIPVAFQNLNMLALYPGNDYICALPRTTSGTVAFAALQSDANYDVTDSNYEPFDPTDPWPCPGPPTHPPATDPGAAVSFDENNQLIVSWAAPATILSTSIFGYKVSLSVTPTSKTAAKAIRGWVGKTYQTYQTSVGSLPGGLTVSSSIYTLATGVVANDGAYPRGTYTLDLDVLYIDGQLSDSLTASGSTPPLPAFPAFTNLAVSLNTAGTALGFTWSQASAAPNGFNFAWSIAEWDYGGTRYSALASGATTSQAVSQAVSFSDLDVGSSCRMTVTGSAPGYTSATAQWWGIVRKAANPFSADLSTVGPLFAAPTLASAAGSSTSLTLNLQLQPGAPDSTTLYYVVRQRRLYNSVLSEVTLADSSSTSTSITVPVDAGMLTGLQGQNYFLLDVYATAVGFYRSDSVSYTLTVVSVVNDALTLSIF